MNWKEIIKEITSEKWYEVNPGMLGGETYSRVGIDVEKLAKFLEKYCVKSGGRI